MRFLEDYRNHEELQQDYPGLYLWFIVQQRPKNMVELEKAFKDARCERIYRVLVNEYGESEALHGLLTLAGTTRSGRNDIAIVLSPKLIMRYGARRRTFDKWEMAALKIRINSGMTLAQKNSQSRIQ